MIRRSNEKITPLIMIIAVLRVFNEETKKIILQTVAVLYKNHMGKSALGFSVNFYVFFFPVKSPRFTRII